MCGKDSHLPSLRPVCPGSPPHVRERLVLISSPLSASRITPACAGKTFDVAFIFQVVQDHPRMCGKDSHHTSHCSWLLGSPPHVRERLDIAPFFAMGSGITPACAGKTVMDPFIFALLRLPTFKIYLISLLNI